MANKKKQDLLKRLGNRIKELRLETNISQTELANRIGKDQQSVQRLEAGNVNPTFYYLYEISQGLEVEINELLKF